MYEYNRGLSTRERERERERERGGRGEKREITKAISDKICFYPFEFTVQPSRLLF